MTANDHETPLARPDPTSAWIVRCWRAYVAPLTGAVKVTLTQSRVVLGGFARLLLPSRASLATVNGKVGSNLLAQPAAHNENKRRSTRWFNIQPTVTQHGLHWHHPAKRPSDQV